VALLDELDELDELDDDDPESLDDEPFEEPALELASSFLVVLDAEDGDERLSVL
jgi:hypothetical protein